MKIEYALRDEKINVYSMTLGGLKSKFSHQFLLCKKNIFKDNRIGSFLLDAKRSKAIYKLSETGNEYLKTISNIEYRLNYIAYIDIQLKIEDNIDVFKAVHHEGFFSI